MAYVEMARGCLLPEAIVHSRQVRCLLDITCLTFWLYCSPGGLAAFPKLLQIKYCPFRCTKISWPYKLGGNKTHKDTNFTMFIFLKKTGRSQTVCVGAWNGRQIDVYKTTKLCVSKPRKWVIYFTVKHVSMYLILNVSVPIVEWQQLPHCSSLSLFLIYSLRWTFTYITRF